MAFVDIIIVSLLKFDVIILLKQYQPMDEIARSWRCTENFLLVERELDAEGFEHLQIQR